MADEATPIEGGNGTPEPTPSDAAAQAEAARQLLIAQGHQVLDSSQFHRIKTEAAAEAEAKAAEAAARLEAIQAENAKLAEYKARIENKDKSDSELHAEQRRAWQAADKERQVAIEAANEQLANAQAELAKERVQNRLSNLMPNATNPEAALMWADKHIGKMLSTDEGGQLVWTDPTGTPHIGIAAEKNVVEWWSQDGQKFLHQGNVPGPPTAGAPSAPTPQAPGKFKPDPNKSQMENYRAAEEWDRTHGAG